MPVAIDARRTPEATGRRAVEHTGAMPGDIVFRQKFRAENRRKFSDVKTSRRCHALSILEPSDRRTDACVALLARTVQVNDPRSS